MKILVVDDDPTTLAIVHATLKKLGHEVTLREDGARAWQAFQQESFTAVV
ncbi:MAG TPA: diguanylate cyclase response regulator, partial [Opitutae bacterium]|nr:diguanylate cyclase response regulator [Opitutae bacterium]